MGQLLLKFSKCAHEKQSEPLSQPRTVYREGAASLSKPNEHGFRAATGKENPCLLEKNT